MFELDVRPNPFTTDNNTAVLNKMMNVGVDPKKAAFDASNHWLPQNNGTEWVINSAFILLDHGGP